MIVTDDDVLGGEPRIDGTRVAVRHVVARALDGGESPASVADQLDLDLAAVYEALSYYYANTDEVDAVARENEAAFERIGEESLKPKEPVQ